MLGCWEVKADATEASSSESEMPVCTHFSAWGGG